jgi:molybdopterin-binding protein
MSLTAPHESEISILSPHTQTPEGACLLLNKYMKLSARNQLPGVVEAVYLGDIMAHVTVKVGENLVESVITRQSAEELGLKKGDSVRVVVKSTEVMIQKG